MTRKDCEAPEEEQLRDEMLGLCMAFRRREVTKWKVSDQWGRSCSFTVSHIKSTEATGLAKEEKVEKEDQQMLVLVLYPIFSVQPSATVIWAGP